MRCKVNMQKSLEGAARSHRRREVGEQFSLQYDSPDQ